MTAAATTGASRPRAVITGGIVGPASVRVLLARSSLLALGEDARSPHGPASARLVQEGALPVVVRLVSDHLQRNVAAADGAGDGRVRLPSSSMRPLVGP